MTTARGQAAIFAIAMTATTVAGHVAGHGSITGLGWAMPMLAVAFAARVALGRRICSWPLCAAVCATLQLGGHLLLMRAAPTPSGAALAGNPGICGDSLAPGAVGHSAVAQLNHLPPSTHAAHWFAGLFGNAGGAHWAMLAAHLAAALVTAWWLHRGELVAEAVGAWVAARVLPPRLHELPAPRRIWSVDSTTVVRRLRTLLLVLDAPGRAPPPAWA